MATIDLLRNARIAKVKTLRKLGFDPYPAVVKRDQKITDARKMEGKNVKVTGRVRSLRGHGKIMFADLVDESGKIQVFFKADNLSKKLISLMGFVDIGDFLSVEGKVGKTTAGEISVIPSDFAIISKSIRPLPDKWYGLKDIEERYRQRYVDLIVNPEVKKIFLTRTKVVKFIRAYLDRDDFVEVETPVLQPIYGGASAKPFVTHHNTLDVDMFLRISDELYLKRLIAGGFEKVYEIGKDFRNEGMDKEHNPEFTQIEFYWAYSNYEELMRYTEKMLSALVMEIKGTLKFSFQGLNLDFSLPWPRVTYRDTVLKYTGIDINKAKNEKQLLKAIAENKINVDLEGVVGYGAILDSLYKAHARPNLTGPLFLTDRPTAFVTLAKRIPGDPDKTASFQLLAAGKELINAYNELNDPEDQSSRWMESEKLGQSGQSEHEAFDDDYIRALEYGMPPTAGWGMGIDRLVSILTDQHTLKDVILFPTLRPEIAEKPKSQKAKEEKSEGNINRDAAWKLIKEHMKNQNLIRHCLAVEAVMKSLGEHFHEDKMLWGIAGLMHDADYEETKSDTRKHAFATAKWLKEINADDRIINAVLAHAWKFVNGAPEPQNRMEWALYTCDDLTGLIVAVALVRPDKKLSSVTVDAVLKKWDSKSFAAGANREQIKLSEEKLGIKLSEFIQIALSAMQSISGELGL